MGSIGKGTNTPNYTVSNTSDMKNALLDSGFILEKTKWKGRYKVTNPNLGTYDTIRFGKDNFGNPEVKRLSGTDFDGRDTWMGYDINSYIRRLK